jgi:hypothetical protein
MPCIHKPVIKFNNLLSGKPRYTCRNCGAAIEMLPVYGNINRVMSMIFMGVLLLKVFSNNSSFGLTGVPKLLADLGMMIGLIAVYLLIMLLLSQKANYQEIKAAEPGAVPGKEDAPEQEKPPYTQEQIDLMAMYAAYEKQAAQEAGLPLPDEQLVEAPAKPVPETDTCDHVPKATWKNHIPGQFNFVCENCGKPISFASSLKKRINMIFLVMSLIVIFPAFSNLNLEYWKFSLLVLAVLILSTIAQFFFLKRGTYELRKDAPAKK